MDSYELPKFEKAGAAKDSDPSGHKIPKMDQFQGRAEKVETQKFSKKATAESKKNYANFNSNKFQQEGTLLTNVEEYSSRIRDDADHHAHKVREEVDLLKSEIELELANALIKRVEAEEDAAHIIKKAEDSSDDVIKAGTEEGYKAGFDDGAERYKEENEKNTGSIMSMLKEIQNLKLTLLQENEQEFVKLCLLLSQKVVHQNLQTQESAVLGMLRANVKRFAGMGNIQIRLNPVEYDFISQYQEELQSFLDEEQVLRLKIDPEIESAEPIIESNFTAIDLDIKKQFREIEINLNNIIEDRQSLFKPQSE